MPRSGGCVPSSIHPCIPLIHMHEGKLEHGWRDHAASAVNEAAASIWLAWSPLHAMQEVFRFLSNPRKPCILAMSRPDAKKNITTLVKAFGEHPQLRKLANLVLVMVCLPPPEPAPACCPCNASTAVPASSSSL